MFTGSNQIENTFYVYYSFVFLFKKNVLNQKSGISAATFIKQRYIQLI